MQAPDSKLQIYAPNDVLIIEFLEQADFTNGRAWDTLILSFQPYLLERNDCVRVQLTGFVYDTIRPCKEATIQRELFQLRRAAMGSGMVIDRSPSPGWSRVKVIENETAAQHPNTRLTHQLSLF
jgi:hypothetical protein